MKVYTVQPVDFLQSVDSEGFIYPKKRYTELSVFFDNPNAVGALHWLEEEYTKRIQLPLDRDLIWLWRDTCHLKYARKDKFTDFSKYNFYCFEIPIEFYRKNILWSRFIEWHEPLNHEWETDEDQEFEHIFDIPKHTGYGDIQGVTTRLHKDWIKKITRN